MLASLVASSACRRPSSLVLFGHPRRQPVCVPDSMVQHGSIVVFAIPSCPNCVCVLYPLLFSEFRRFTSQMDSWCLLKILFVEAVTHVVFEDLSQRCRC